MVAANVSVFADDHDNHQYVHHDEWKKGAKIQNEDWNRGEHVDYRERHLRAPPNVDMNGGKWTATMFSRRWPPESLRQS
jgi:Ni/Co efflux regulator RcnB